MAKYLLQFSLVLAFWPCSLFAQNNDTLPNIEKVIWYSDGTHSLITYSEFPESYKYQEIEQAIQSLNDSVFLAQYKRYLSAGEKFDPKFLARPVGVQFLTWSKRPIRTIQRAVVKLDNRISDTLKVDFSKRDSLFTDFAPLLFVPYERVHEIELEFMTSEEISIPVFTNWAMQPLKLLGLFPEEQYQDLLRHVEVAGKPYYYNFTDTLALVRWADRYPQEDLEKLYTLRYIQRMPASDSFQIRAQDVVVPKICSLMTNEKLYFWFSEIYPQDVLEFRLTPWLNYASNEIPWKKGAPGSSILGVDFPDAGSFQVQVRNSNNPEAVFRKIVVLVSPRWYQTMVFKLSLLGISGLMLIILYLFWFRRRQGRRIKALEHLQQESAVNLGFIRAQLNPHFVFNALNSIQGLIMKGESNKANEYLVAFSTLLRKTMDPLELNYWSLSEELKMLENYVRIEQLRSHFGFSLSVDIRLSCDQVSFPSLLLQPAVENSIKHGFVGEQDFKLEVVVKKNGSDLIVLIKDNGLGFDPSSEFDGKGLALTKSYIALLNRAHADCEISFDPSSAASGTCVIFMFRNWLDE